MTKQWTMRVLHIVLCLFVLALTACTPHDTIPDYVKNPLFSNLPKQQQELITYIETSGIQVIKQGMTFTFVIPTDCFFNRRTQQLKESQRKTLDILAQFIHDYTSFFARPRVTVTGYTDKVWLYYARIKLSKHYANVIAQYLDEDGINPDIMTVNGVGAKHQIASNHYPMGTAFNRRVEVVVQ